MIGPARSKPLDGGPPAPEAMRTDTVVFEVSTISVHRHLAVPLAVAWDELTDIEHHIEWMADAVSIEFVSDQRRGAGTRFSCLTQVGPLKTRDLMEITGWEEGSSITVRHSGLITGEGRLELRVNPNNGCQLTWNEVLRFPVVVGGPLAAAIAQPILTRIWRGNLQRFEQSALRRLESNEP